MSSIWKSEDNRGGVPTGNRYPANPQPAAHSLLPVALAAVYFAIALASIEWTRDEARIAAIWLPNALVLGLLLRFDHLRIGPTLAWLVTASVGANLAAGDDALTALVLAMANGLETALALWLTIRWCGRNPELESLPQLGRMLLASSVIAPAAGALFAVFSLGGDTAAELAGQLATWFLADGLGMMLMAPSVMIVVDALRQSPGQSIADDLKAWILIGVIGLAVMLLVFCQSSYPLLFLCAPVILLFAYRLGMLATALSTLSIAVIATAATAMDSGPIALMDGSLTSRLIVLQVFLVGIFATGLPVAAALAHKRRLLSELEDRERQLALLANNVTDAVLRFDLDGVCVDASPSVREVLARPQEDFIGRPATSAVHPEAAEAIAATSERLRSGRREKERFTYRRLKDRPDGTPVYIEADCALVRNSISGAPEAIIVCARDVSERVALERQLKRARRHAEHATAAKSQFLMNMSHEIRTPMNGVLGFAELLQRADLPEEPRKHAELILESGRSMMHLLDDILDISKIEAGKIAIRNEPVNLPDLIAGCVQLHSANAARKGLALECDLAPDLPNAISSDALRVRQILLNLMGNAVKFTAAGHVRISARRRGVRVVITVSDTGIGIPRAGIENIFEPFRQADGTTARQFGGTGLGLTISRQLATLLGGSLTVRSEPGEGSHFTLNLPARPVTAVPDTAAPAIPALAPALPPHCHILLAEDHDINRLLVTAMLESCGQRVTHASDGQQAVDLLVHAGALDRPVDLVLMDIQMPRLDGFEATRRIRAAGHDAVALPIIALSANAYDDDIVASQLAGMQDHLAKPLKMDALMAALHKWLPDSGTAAGRAAPVSEAGRPAWGADRLQQSWTTRRQEALDAVAALVRSGQFVGQEADKVARLAHKLAGTAAMFGEQALGDHAGALENALCGRSGDDPAQIARALLAAA